MDSNDKPRIMIVEDEPEITEFLSEYLEASYHVSVASSVTQACELLAHSQFELILTDLNLPDCRGKSSVSHYRQINFTGVILLLTGHDEFHPEVVQALADGANTLIKKPFSLPEVKEAVVRHLSRLTPERKTA